MGVLEICRVIGVELRRTIEGKRALENYNDIVKSLDESSKDLFIKLLPHIPWGLHFYDIEARIGLFEANRDNATLGREVIQILSRPNINECSEQMSLLGRVIEEVSISLFQNNVQYTLSEQIHATPQLYRGIQDLSVACQNTKILQTMINKIKSDKHFFEIMQEFEVLRKRYGHLPYSRESRKIIKVLIQKGYNPESVKTIYSFMAIMMIIKQAIYDSFMDRIYEVKESEDILSLRERNVDDVQLVEIELLPTSNVLSAQEKWIIRIEKNTGEILYGQVFTKNMHWTKEKMEIKQKALMYLKL